MSESVLLTLYDDHSIFGGPRFRPRSLERSIEFSSQAPGPAAGTRFGISERFSVERSKLRVMSSKDSSDIAGPPLPTRS